MLIRRIITVGNTSEVKYEDDGRKDGFRHMLPESLVKRIIDQTFVNRTFDSDDALVRALVSMYAIDLAIEVNDQLNELASECNKAMSQCYQ